MFRKYSPFEHKSKSDEEIVAQVNQFATIASAMWMTVVGSLGILFMPLIVSGIIDRLSFSEQQAGYIAAAEMAGVAIMSGSGVIWMRRIDWVVVSFLAIVVLVVSNLFSALMTSFEGMFLFRFLVGASSGVLLAIGLACQNDSKDASRIFGYWVACQMTVSTVGYLSLPIIRSVWGISGLFMAFALISITAIVSIYFMPRRGLTKASAGTSKILTDKRNILALFGALLFFMAQGGIWAFLEELGNSSQLTTTEISFALAVSSYFGIVGGLARNWVENLVGILGPFYCVVVGELLMLVLFAQDASNVTYVLAACMLQFFWAMGMASLLAGLNIIDDSGRLILLMMASAKTGYSLGPALMGWLISDDDYTIMLVTWGVFVAFGISTCGFLVNQKTRHNHEV